MPAPSATPGAGQDGASNPDQSGEAAPVPSPTNPAGPAAARRRKARPGLGTGKPRTPWNVWLMHQMRTLPTEELYNFQPFFPGWLNEYMQRMGVPPDYPEDTFKQAAIACAERIIRERGAGAS